MAVRTLEYLNASINSSFVFRSLRCRKDIRELFEHLAVSARSVSDSSLAESEDSSPSCVSKNKRIGKLILQLQRLGARTPNPGEGKIGC